MPALLQFNVESSKKRDAVSGGTSIGAVAPIGFRVNPDVAAGTHAKIYTGTADNKFGIRCGASARRLWRGAALPGLKITGITLHIGSQLMSLAPLEAAFSVWARSSNRFAPRATRSALSISAAASACRTAGQPSLRAGEYGAMVRRVTRGLERAADL